MKEFYGVRVGRVPGVYDNWDDCKKQITGIKNGSFKKFKDLLDAERYVETDNSAANQGVIKTELNIKLLCTLCSKSIVSSTNLIQCNENCETFYHTKCMFERYKLEFIDIETFCANFRCYSCQYKHLSFNENPRVSTVPKCRLRIAEISDIQSNQEETLSRDLVLIDNTIEKEEEKKCDKNKKETVDFRENKFASRDHKVIGLHKNEVDNGSNIFEGKKATDNRGKLTEVIVSKKQIGRRFASVISENKTSGEKTITDNSLSMNESIKIVQENEVDSCCEEIERKIATDRRKKINESVTEFSSTTKEGNRWPQILSKEFQTVAHKRSKRTSFTEVGIQTEIINQELTSIEVGTQTESVNQGPTSVNNQNISRSVIAPAWTQYGSGTYQTHYFYNSNKKLQSYNLFIGGLDKDYKTIDLHKMVMMRVGNKNKLTCYKLKSKGHNSSFCVTSGVDCLDSLCRWDNWPSGVIIRRFKGPLEEYLIDETIKCHDIIEVKKSHTVCVSKLEVEESENDHSENGQNLSRNQEYKLESNNYPSSISIDTLAVIRKDEIDRPIISENQKDSSEIVVNSEFSFSHIGDEQSLNSYTKAQNKVNDNKKVYMNLCEELNIKTVSNRVAADNDKKVIVEISKSCKFSTVTDDKVIEECKPNTDNMKRVTNEVSKVIDKRVNKKQRTCNASQDIDIKESEEYLSNMIIRLNKESTSLNYLEKKDKLIPEQDKLGIERVKYKAMTIWGIKIQGGRIDMTNMGLNLYSFDTININKSYDSLNCWQYLKEINGKEANLVNRDNEIGITKIYVSGNEKHYKDYILTGGDVDLIATNLKQEENCKGGLKENISFNLERGITDDIYLNSNKQIISVITLQNITNNFIKEDNLKEIMPIVNDKQVKVNEEAIKKKIVKCDKSRDSKIQIDNSQAGKNDEVVEQVIKVNKDKKFSSYGRQIKLPKR